MKRIIALDTETERIEAGNVIPKMICLSVYGVTKGKTLEGRVWGNHPDDGVEEALRSLISTTDTLIVTHNGAYDWAVICRSYPDLIPLVFDRLAAEDYCTDTQYRELLLNLSTTGKLDHFKLPNGQSGQLRYGLADLETRYLGIDRSAQKEDLEESWRINYSALDGWKAEDYPADARQYAMEDAKGTYEVYMAQEERKREPPHAQTVTEGFQTFCAFTLFLETAWGMKVNKANVQYMKERVEPVVQANRSLLIEHGIMQPGRGGEPHKRQLQKAIDIVAAHLKREGLEDAHQMAAQMEIETCGWEPFRELLANRGVKMKKPVADVIKQEPLQARAAAIFKAIGEIPEMTDGGSISLAEGVPEMLAQYDEVFEQYWHRQELIKLTTQHIPLLESAEIIYPNYGVLKETGRTSSYGNKKGKPGLFPATNIQNIPGAEIEGIDVRQCFEPRPGKVFFDVDGTALELATTGQICFNLFGESRILELYNAKIDLHAYTASYLLIEVGGPGLPTEFQQLCREEGILGDRMAVYDAFMECKHSEDKDVREKLYKHWRTFSKPVNLGFPGGLGPATMVTFAKQTYDVEMTEKQAHEAREVWRQTFPEMPRYHKWVNGQTDEYNSQGDETLYQYVTPLGMLRRGAAYCAAANGMCMQSPGAEGMKLANAMVVRESYDKSQDSVLFGCRPIAFVHDQIIGEVTKDKSLWHDQVQRASQLICKAMKVVLPDINFRCDEAHLTSVWSKKSEPTFGEDGRLVPWTPKK